MADWRECLGPGVAVGPSCGLSHLAAVCLRDGRSSRSKELVAPITSLVTVSLRDGHFEQEIQWLAPLRDLVTQGRHDDPCANTADGAPATPGLGRRSPGRGNSLGFVAPRANVLGWQPCWPLGSPGPSSSAGDGDCVGQDEITFGSACIYDGVHGPWRPPGGGHIIGPKITLSVVVVE
jgi:hypothetical protein